MEDTIGERTRVRPRWPGLLVAALLLGAAALVIVLLVYDRRDQGPRAPIATTVQPALDLRVAAPPDAGADQGGPTADVPRPRPTPKRRPRIISAREVRQVQRRYGSMLDACYRVAARRAPSTVTKRVDIIAVLGEGGRVSSVRITGTEDPSLIRCLRASVESFRFPRDLQPQEVAFPIIFIH